MKNIVKSSLIRDFIQTIGKARIDFVIKSITPYLNKNTKIIDIGCGLCVIAKKIRDLRFNIVPLDIRDISLYKEIIPVLYDGRKIPYSDDYFDTSLIITVLHHIQNPESLLKEAKRVSKKVIIMEDIYDNVFQKYLTFVMDCLVNLEFFSHPHSNKTDKDWRELFTKMDLKVNGFHKKRFWHFFTSATYILEKNTVLNQNKKAANITSGDEQLNRKKEL